MKNEEKYINSYEALPVGKWMELQDIAKDEEADNVDKNIGIVSVLTDIDEVELYNMPISKFSPLLDYADFMKAPMKPEPIKDKYPVGEWVLEPVVNFGQMTTAQFIDYQTYIKDPEENLVEILSVFLIPSGHNYNDGYDMEALQGDIRNKMSIVDANSLSAFFLLLYKSLSGAILHSLVKKMKKEMKKMNPEQRKRLDRKIQGLARNGAGYHA